MKNGHDYDQSIIVYAWESCCCKETPRKRRRSDNKMKHLWCNAPSRNYFCATEIAESKKGVFSFPLVEMLLSPKGTKPLEEF